jgi:hypothetical protein
MSVRTLRVLLVLAVAVVVGGAGCSPSEPTSARPSPGSSPAPAANR